MSGLSPYIVAGISVAGALTLLAHPAAAQNLCVDCTGPDRSYSCSIKDADKFQQFRSAKRAQEFVCISELARAGGHESCRINSTFSGPCMGQQFEIDVAKIGSESLVIGRPPGEPPAETSAAKGVVNKGPPQTLEELARNTVTKSKEQISVADEGVKKAGNAVGGAVKKTWECVVSLFQKC